MDRTTRTQLYKYSQRYQEIKPCYPYLHFVNLDEAIIELYWSYSGQLEDLGVDMVDDNLQEVLNGHPFNLESAILATIKYGKKNPFQNQRHATNFLIKALREGWKP